MAVADVYDALISRRPYKAPMPHEQAVAFIREGAGNHFDPQVVDAFERSLEQFIHIAYTWSDE
jgi:putative two-component system response regulator